MDISPTWAFRLLLVALLATSTYFTIDVELRRAAARGTAVGLELSPGEVVEITSAVDGDEMTVNRGEQTFTVRMIGVKAFEPRNEPGPGNAGIRAREYLEGYVGQSATLEFGERRVDGNDRVLAFVHIDAEDLGERMVRDGRVMVYTKYPFDREQKYLAAELQAQADQRGMWASEKVVVRAAALRASWSEEAQ